MPENYCIRSRKDSDNRYAVYFEMKSLWDPATYSFPLDAITRIIKALNKLSLGCNYGENFICNLENVAAKYQCEYNEKLNMNNPLPLLNCSICCYRGQRGSGSTCEDYCQHHLLVAGTGVLHSATPPNWCPLRSL